MPTKAKTTTKTTKTSAKSTLSLTVFDIKGVSKGKIELPKELFATKINNILMSQAVHVYLNNQRRGTVAQKTRGDITASTKKIYRQKGTGRARHGALSAPIFVGGGVTFAAKPRDFSKKLSKKMKFQSLTSALTQKLSEGKITVVDMDKASGKTKEIASALKNLKFEGKKKNILVVINGKNETLKRALKNIEGVECIPGELLNTYQTLKSHNILFTKEGLEALKNNYFKEKSKTTK